MITSLVVTLITAAIGGGGVWLLALFVPSAALLLRAALDFLRSPLGLVIAVIAGGLFLFTSGWIGGDIHGTTATRAAWRADNAAKKAEAEREIATNKLRAAADADKRIAALDDYAKSLKARIETYERENPGRDGMRLSDDDVKRMRHGLK